ncbi:MAG TPA: sn-glycerol-1-phosphate dehydrogenase [Propionibacteriaceae bacterium]|nr:sn-glycerol-1-phosphate dehydrogenase [Propionibacteriaceae bacterium]
MSELIDRALRTAPDTAEVLVGEGVLAELPAVFRRLFGDVPAIVVADGRTLAAAGERVVGLLEAAGVPQLEPYVFPGEPELYARYENCDLLRDALRPVDAVAVAVGSGTLNDLVKRACGELGRGYLVVGTAASMDGYTAFGASIAYEGFKQTLSCPPPRAAICDLGVLAAAPPAMTASGYGDLIGKVPAGADWLLADALGVEPIHQGAWDLVQGPLRHALARPADLPRAEPGALADLTEGLVMSGLAMQAQRSSRPASGAEHQFSHLWEMEGLGVDRTPRRLPHGFKVGIGTVAVAALYERLLERDLTALDVDAAVAGWPDREEAERRVRAMHPAGGLADESVRLTLDKWVPSERLRERLERLRRVWPELSERLRAQLIPAAELQDMLRAAGAPAHPAEIGLDRGRFRDTYQRARTIRNRYTVLDTAFEAGLLSDLVAELFAPHGFWGRRAA